MPTTVVTVGQPKVTEPGSVDTEEDRIDVPAQHVLEDITLDSETELYEEAIEKTAAQADEEAKGQEGKNAVDHNGGQAGEAADHKPGADQEAVEMAAAEILGKPEAVMGKENVQNTGEGREEAGLLTTELVELQTEEAAGAMPGEEGELGATTGASQEKASHKTEIEGDTYMPPHLHGFDAGDPQQRSNTVGRKIIEDSKYFNEILASEDEPANLDPTLASAVKKIKLLLTYNLSSSKPAIHLLIFHLSDSVAPGTEAWKIGGIFAAVLLILETAVIAVYCLKCKTRTTRYVGKHRF
ncbi:hypothetical protein GN956_G12265 [Arapaima gigas]